MAEGKGCWRLILREREDRFILIRQHDHGRISGDFADHWKEPIDRSTRIGIRFHDVGWEALDREVRWNPATGKPYSFEDYPLDEKLPSYTAGVDRVEAKDLFAGCICSMHFVSFFTDLKEPEAIRFVEREQARQKRLIAAMGEGERKKLKGSLGLLKLCDDLSLFLCLNEPGQNEHPWYREGFRREGEFLQPVWEARDQLRIDPSPFRCSFEVRIPYQMVARDRQFLEHGTYRIRILNRG